MNAKICKQCGELKPIEQFRKYYGGRKGTYKTCKLCERINARAKYLRAKGDMGRTQDENAELLKIYQLYEAQRAAGLQPPREGQGRKTPLVDSIDDMINKYSAQAAAAPTDITIDVPAEIKQWLSAELIEEPDYYLDEVYEELKSKFRPQLRIDTATMQPVYDDTYKSALDAVLERFYKYEETYWNEEDSR